MVDSRCSTNVMSWSISVVQPWQWNSRSSPRFTLRCWQKFSNLKRKEYNRLITKNTLILDDLRCKISVGYFASTREFEFLRADQGASKQFLAGWTCWSEGIRKKLGIFKSPRFYGIRFGGKYLSLQDCLQSFGQASHFSHLFTFKRSTLNVTEGSNISGAYRKWEQSETSVPMSSIQVILKTYY